AQANCAPPHSNLPTPNSNLACHAERKRGVVARLSSGLQNKKASPQAGLCRFECCATTSVAPPLSASRLTSCLPARPDCTDVQSQRQTAECSHEAATRLFVQVAAEGEGGHLVALLDALQVLLVLVARHAGRERELAEH